MFDVLSDSVAPFGPGVSPGTPDQADLWFLAASDLGTGPAPTNITGVALWAGHALGQILGSAALKGFASAEGNVASGVLSGAGALQGISAALGVALGRQGSVLAITGVALGQGASTGVLTGGGALTGVAIAQGYGVLLLTPLLSGKAFAQGFARGPIQGAGALQGVVAIGETHALGQLGWLGQSQGFAAGSSFAYGLLADIGLPYGFAAITAPRRTLELSSFEVGISYFDMSRTPFEPNHVNYRIDDVLSGAAILDWTAIDNPGVANSITVTSAQNAMISLSRHSEWHQVLFQIIDGFGDVFYARVLVDVTRVVGLN